MSEIREACEQNTAICLAEHPEVDEHVLDFINDFVCHRANTYDDYEVLRGTFRAGYCYYFAHMLKLAFSRGKVCLAAPYGHMVWVDTDGTPYDIEGAYFGDCLCFIDEEELGDSIEGFLHVDGRNGRMGETQMEALMNKHGFVKDGDHYVKKHEDNRNEDLLRNLVGNSYDFVLPLLPDSWRDLDDNALKFAAFTAMSVLIAKRC